MWYVLFFIPYVLLMLIFLYGWHKMHVSSTANSSASTFTSIVLTVRNEEKNIVKLIHSIAQQSHTQYELIIIDDHSEDTTFSLVSSMAKEFLSITLLKSDFKGKKLSQRQAILSAQGELIVCIDADAYYPPTWLETLVHFYEQERPDMIIAPVRMHAADSLFSKLQALEFLTLSASTAASASVASAIMCNGSNMAFTKSHYVSVQSLLVDEEASGDDMFLLAATKKLGRKVLFLPSKQAIAEIETSDSMYSFLQQRMRWIAKAKSYADMDIIVSSLAVFFAQVGILLCGILSFFNVHLLPFFVSLFLLKFLLDTLLLYKAAPLYNQQGLVKYSMILSVVYPFYVFFVAILSLIVPIRWKGRKI